ncbi:MAG: 3-phosphoshikimate 1-carboxyvinyltransferase, partial [Actinomycetota bacterium]
WLILAATANGHSRLVGLPPSLDVRSTAACLAELCPKARPALDVWVQNAPSAVEDGGSTWNGAAPDAVDAPLEVEGEGRSGLVRPDVDLDCANSGTSMRLLTGVLAAAPFRSLLVGDPSLSTRPMERVAEPLRRMGASVITQDGTAPIIVEGGELHGIRHEMLVASAQVKSAVLLAGVAAAGETTVVEPAATRDHTERLLRALGAPVRMESQTVTLSAFAHRGFEGRVPGDLSSAAFLVIAAAATGGEIAIHHVGLNPTRSHYLEVMERMGVRTSLEVEREEMGEPVGTIRVHRVGRVVPAEVGPDELPLVIDEVPALAALAALADGASRFRGAGELRVKESDRLGSVTAGVVGLGGGAEQEGDDLLIEGGGLAGGRADAAGDHRIAMALAAGALGAHRPCEITGMESADVSFPGFVTTLRNLGAVIEVLD